MFSQFRLSMSGKRGCSAVVLCVLASGLSVGGCHSRQLSRQGPGLAEESGEERVVMQGGNVVLTTIWERYWECVPLDPILPNPTRLVDAVLTADSAYCVVHRGSSIVVVSTCDGAERQVHLTGEVRCIGPGLQGDEFVVFGDGHLRILRASSMSVIREASCDLPFEGYRVRALGDAWALVSRSMGAKWYWIVDSKNLQCEKREADDEVVDAFGGDGGSLWLLLRKRVVKVAVYGNGECIVAAPVHSFWTDLHAGRANGGEFVLYSGTPTGLYAVKAGESDAQYRELRLKVSCARLWREERVVGFCQGKLCVWSGVSSGSVEWMDKHELFLPDIGGVQGMFAVTVGIEGSMEVARLFRREQ